MQKIILISGATTGIGKAIAVSLANKGECVFAGARKEHDMAELGKIPNITPIKLDVINANDILIAVRTIEQSKGHLDVLINNAGIATGGPILELPEKILRDTFEVNVFGMFNLTNACFPLLFKAKGRILNVSSISGRWAAPFLGSYNMSKFAVEAYSDTLRRELLPFGMKVSLIEPGPIITAIWGKADAQMKEAETWIGPLFKGRASKAMGDFIHDSSTTGMDVGVVVNAMNDAIYNPKPKTRYLVVKNKFRFKLADMISDEALDKVL